MVAERPKDFEQVPDALARQIVRRGGDHLIDHIQIQGCSTLYTTELID